MGKGPIFHWSGDNSESNRQQAASELLHRWLLPLEWSETPYHIIGHSHGGSVIWNALVLAGEKGFALKHLQSWASVGTPFLSYATSLLKQLGLFVGRFLSMLLAIGFSYCVLYLIVMFAMNEFASSWIGVAKTVLFVYVITISCGCSAVFLWGELFDAIRANRAYRAAVHLYLPKWLGLWSQSDEAFAGIAHALSPKVALARDFVQTKTTTAVKKRCFRRHPKTRFSPLHSSNKLGGFR